MDSHAERGSNKRDQRSLLFLVQFNHLILQKSQGLLALFRQFVFFSTPLPRFGLL
jgi:hypothetical protein